MWIVYSLSAAVIWGISYATSGRVIARGMSPLTFFFYYAAFSGLASAIALAASGRIDRLTGEVRVLGPDIWWFAISIVTSAAGALLIYMAIGEKNATLASLIEISYPFFVAIFAWLLFRETQLNLPTALGGLMILAGVAIVFISNK